MLRVIDTSFWKQDIINSSVDIDAVYTKATEGTYYVDPSCDPIVQWANSRDKKWGVFHFATNRVTGPVTEADYFVDNCLGYIGKGLLVLDNETYYWSDRAWANDPSNVQWALDWLNRVYARTGVRPLIYMSLSVIRGSDWSPVIRAGYGLICAAYIDDSANQATPIPNWQMDPKRDPNPYWDGVVNDVMWQFTSTGRLNGYGGNLDCNFFYGTRETWDAYARAAATPAPTTTTTTTAEPTTTTTTTEAQPSPDPNPTTTTTTTQESQPAPPETTTTTTTVTGGKPAVESFWQKLIRLLILFFTPKGK